MQVSKSVTFSYGHRLSNYQGKCRMIHGHNGKLEVTIERETLDDTGFVIDFGDLKKEINEISDYLDHKLLLKFEDDANKKILEVVPKDWIVWFDRNPTAENIADYIITVLKTKIVCDKIIVKLWETDNSFVTIEIDNKE